MNYNEENMPSLGASVENMDFHERDDGGLIEQQRAGKSDDIGAYAILLKMSRININLKKSHGKHLVNIYSAIEYI